MAIGTGTALLIGGGLSAAGAAYTASSARGDARDSRRAMESAQDRELNFAMDQQERWENVFGPIQDSLSDYYQNLDPDIIAARGIEEYEAERETALTRVNEVLAQRGLSESGIAANVEIQSELNSAEERARIRADAPMQAARERLNFLSVGLGQNPSGRTQNALARQSNQMATTADRATSVANRATAQSTQAIGDFATTVLDRFTLSEDGE